MAASTLAEAFPLPDRGRERRRDLVGSRLHRHGGRDVRLARAAVVGLLTIARRAVAEPPTDPRDLQHQPLRLRARSSRASLPSTGAAETWRPEHRRCRFVGSAAFCSGHGLLSAVIAAAERGYFRTLWRYVTTTALPFLVIASLTVTLVVLWGMLRRSRRSSSSGR
jgi:hypothetical protein